jgi:hypothetical protein
MDEIRACINTNRVPKKQEIGGIFVFVIKNSKSKLKYQKTIEFDVLFNVYLIVLLSCRSNLAGRYL